MTDWDPNPPISRSAAVSNAEAGASAQSGVTFGWRTYPSGPTQVSASQTVSADNLMRTRRDAMDAWDSYQSTDPGRSAGPYWGGST